MANFEITYTSGRRKTIEADGFTTQGADDQWTDFYVESSNPREPQQYVLRLRSQDIKRIERV